MPFHATIMQSRSDPGVKKTPGPGGEGGLDQVGFFSGFVS